MARQPDPAVLFRETRRIGGPFLWLYALATTLLFLSLALGSGRPSVLAIAAGAMMLVLFLALAAPEVTEVRPGMLRIRTRGSPWVARLWIDVTFSAADVSRVHVSSYYGHVDGGKGWGCRAALHLHLVKGDRTTLTDFLLLPTRDPVAFCAALEEAGFPVEREQVAGASQETSLRASASSL